MTASDRYYALCAASALIHFVGSKRKVVFNDKSLRIVYESMKGGSAAAAEPGPDLTCKVTCSSTRRLPATWSSCRTTSP